MAVYALSVAGSAKSFLVESFRISETANGRNTLTCRFYSADGSYRPALGAEVILTEDATRIFGGHIDAPSETGLAGYGTTEIITTITAIDFSALADRRYVSIDIAAGTLRAAAEALRMAYLNDYGVSATVYVNGSGVTTGPALPALTYGGTYRQLSDVLNEISALSEGYIWEINYDKELRWVLPASTACPFNVVPASDDNAIGDITVEPSRGDYANRIILRFSSNASSAYGFLQTSANFGNGETVVLGSQTYTFQTVLTDVAGNVLIGADQDESLQNLAAAITGGAGSGSIYAASTDDNTAATAYWLRASMLKAVALAEGEAGNSVAVSEACANAAWVTEGGGAITTLALGSDEALSNVVEANDATAQAAVGLWEKVIEAPKVFNFTIAQALANAAVVGSVQAPKRVQYTTEQVGVHPGQTQTITVPDRNLSGTFIVTDVEIFTVSGRARRRVTAQGSTVLTNRWQDDARRLFGGGGSTTIGAVTIGGGSGGGVSGSGTAGKLPVWATAGALTDSIVTQAGTLLSVAGTIQVNGTEAIVDWYESDASVDAKHWRWNATAETFLLQAVNDAYDTATLVAGFTRAGALQIVGTLRADGFGTHLLSASGTGANVLRVVNPTAGTGNYAVLQVGTDVAVYQTSLESYSSTFNPTVGFHAASGSTLHAAGVGGLSLVASDPSAPLRQFWGGTTLKLEGTGTSFLPGSGYSLNLGSLQKKYLTLHAAELWVETLVAQNTIATIGGRVLVAPTNLLSADLAAAATTITVKYNNFVSGDRVYMEADGKVEFMSVDSTPGGSAGVYTYTVTRNLDASGANDWFAGDAILNTGQAGDGFIDIYSVRGIRAGTEIGPTIVGNVRNSATYNDWSPRWAIGNLDGLYGYSGTTYGAAFGVPTAAWIKIDPTNGIRIGHNATTKISLTAAGDASFSGSITASAGAIGGFTIGSAELTATGISIASATYVDGSRFYVYELSTNTGAGVSGVTTGTDVALWSGAFHANRATAPFRVTSAGALTATSATISGSVTATSGSIGSFTIGTYLYTGSKTAYNDANAGVHLGSDGIGIGNNVFTVSAAGALTSISGSIGGWEINATTIEDAAGTVGLSSAVTGGDDIRFWAGHVTPGSAPFRVTEAGALFASNVTITGAVTATSGDVSGALGANSITATMIDVTTLSAISADLGTITAGTISGTTINAGGTNVVLDSDGLTLTSGGLTTNQLKWSSGSFIKDVTGNLSLNASAIELAVTSHAIAFDSSNAALFPSSGTVSLGVTGARWSDLWLTAAGSVAGVLADFESRISALESP